MNFSSPVLRVATHDDVQTILDLLKNAHLPIDGVAEMFARDASQFIVATSGDFTNEIVAAAGIEICAQSALLRSVIVRADWQRKRLGELLVRRAISDATSRGIRQLYLLTTSAEQYFERFGFETITREHVPSGIAATLEFTSACPASAIAMTKSLQAS